MEQEIRVKKIYGESMMIEISFSRLVSVLSSIFDNLYRAFITQNENVIVTYKFNFINKTRNCIISFFESREKYKMRGQG